MAGGAWTDLGDGIRVRRSRIEAMNSGVLRDAGHAVLVDPGVLPSEIAEIAAAAEGARTLIVLTHHHWDHVLGPARIPGATVAASVGFAARLAADADHAGGAIAHAFGPAGEPDEPPHRPFAPDVVLGEAPFAWGPWTLETVPVPGHAADAIAVLAGGVLFAGDLLSDLEPPWLEEPPAAYRASLTRLGPLAGRARALVPGHGALADGADAIAARFAADRAYLDAVERGVRETAARGLGVADAQAALASLDYPGRDAAPHSTVDVHRANVRHAWAARDRRPQP